MLNKIVEVIIDRPIHSTHPTNKDIVYEVNYGYIPDVISPVDQEELDAYVLDIDFPVKKYKGKVIAILHRIGEEDKLIVSNKRFSKEEIYKKTYFQEKYFNSYIEMSDTKKEDLLFDLKKNGFKNTDTVLLHSSLKSFGKIRGEDILEALKEYFCKGLVILPTHSWASITKDGDVFNVKSTPSCVGALSNLALKDSDFVRSLHPTHSVCAYGKYKQAYVDLDLDQSTPVSPTGCFGSLWKMNAKILFLGAPLSKNTFIHSIEEEMKVPDRFTKEIYQFTSIGYDKSYSYKMPRHYSTKRDHLSENYAKLLPHLLKYDIAKELYIGNSKTILVDAKACYDYVKYLLERNIHLFDDDKEYSDDYEGYKKTK